MERTVSISHGKPPQPAVQQSDVDREAWLRSEIERMQRELVTIERMRGQAPQEVGNEVLESGSAITAAAINALAKQGI